MGAKKWALLIVGVLALMVGSVFYGMLAYRQNYPPAGLVQAVYQYFNPPRNLHDDYETIRPDYLETDVASLITIKSPADVARVREALISFLWGSPKLPSRQPDDVVKDHHDNRYSDIESLQRIDKLTVKMAFGLESVIYHFTAKQPNGKLVLYHQGHEGDFIQGKKFIAAFLDHGYDVLAFCMPLVGLNNQPTLDLPRIGKLKLTRHHHMPYLTPEHGHPIQYFLEPVVVALNYTEAEYDYSSTAMTGISGGGWTVVVAAAIDPRIRQSFPVAGSYPIFLRSDSLTDWGDYEQTEPALYNTANYLEMYILGATGEGRKHLQILNKYDACCYSGIKYQTYKDILRDRVRELGGGEYDVYLDDTHKAHAISDAAVERMLSEMGAASR